jgi:hypothetical protein
LELSQQRLVRRASRSTRVKLSEQPPRRFADLLLASISSSSLIHDVPGFAPIDDDVVRKREKATWLATRLLGQDAYCIVWKLTRRNSPPEQINRVLLGKRRQCDYSTPESICGRFQVGPALALVSSK